MLNIAMMMVTPIMALFLLGLFLDNKLNHKMPFLAVLGFVLGAISGFYNIYKSTNK